MSLYIGMLLTCILTKPHPCHFFPKQRHCFVFATREWCHMRKPCLWGIAEPHPPLFFDPVA